MEYRKLNKPLEEYEEFNKLGGKEMLQKVSKIFYDKVYEHSWIGQYFAHIEQEIIESQQVDFMTSALGGPKVYCGRLPIPTHKNMLISSELFELRHDLLLESLKEAGASEELIAKWTKIDNAFKDGIVKSNISECEKRFFTDDILDFKKAS
jgi:truncated hemoglobin YjbI